MSIIISIGLKSYKSLNMYAFIFYILKKYEILYTKKCTKNVFKIH